MAYTISKVNVWAGSIEDRPGGVAEKLDALAKARANLEFVIARRDTPGTGVLFLAPVKGASQTRAAKNAGLQTAAGLHSLRLIGPDRPGLGAKITNALAEAGINMRGISAASLNRKCIVYFAFDSADDANKATRALKKTLR
jgi:hypothetical protein